MTSITEESSESKVVEYTTKELQSKYNLTHLMAQDIVDNAAAQIEQTEITENELLIHYAPKFKGLKAISTHYQKKYGYSIYICPIKRVSRLIQQLVKGELKAFGIIVHREGLKEGTTTHVTPIFGHRSQRNGKLFLLEMDSIGHNSGAKDLTPLIKLNFEKKIYYSFNLKVRQVSKRGCRIDAFSVLKYALFTTSHVQDLADIISFSPGQISYESGKSELGPTFKVPSCWAIGAHLMSGIDRSFDNIVVNRKGDTAEALRNRYRRGIQHKDILTAPYSLTRTITLETSTYRKSLNTYLSVKERKYVALIEKTNESDRN